MSVHLFEERDYNKPYAPTVPGGVQNQLWLLCTWDEKKKELIPDKGPSARLYKVGTSDRAPYYTEEAGCYTGGFPTRDTVDYINSCKDRMIYFDDGKRLRYSKYSTPPEIKHGPVTLNQMMTRMM